jgi:hypothetical protein
MARSIVEERRQMDGKLYLMRVYDKIIPEDMADNLSLHQAATHKTGREPSRSPYPRAIKMSLIRLNLEI